MRRPALILVSATLVIAGCGDDSAHDVVPSGAGTVTRVVQPDSPPTGAFVGSTERCVRFDIQSLKGDPLPVATRRARASGCDVRADKIDGRPQVLTADRVPYRVDVSVINGDVTSVGKLPAPDGLTAPAP